MQYYIIVIETAHSTNIWYLPSHEAVEKSVFTMYYRFKMRKSRKMTNGVLAFLWKSSLNVGNICFAVDRKMLETNTNSQEPCGPNMRYWSWDIHWARIGNTVGKITHIILKHGILPLWTFLFCAIRVTGFKILIRQRPTQLSSMSSVLCLFGNLQLRISRCKKCISYLSFLSVLVSTAGLQILLAKQTYTVYRVNTRRVARAVCLIKKRKWLLLASNRSRKMKLKLLDSRWKKDLLTEILYFHVKLVV